MTENQKLAQDESYSESLAKARIVDFIGRGMRGPALEALGDLTKETKAEVVIDGLKRLLREKFKAVTPQTVRAFEMTEEDFQKYLPDGGTCACPNCHSEKITADNVRDDASSILFVKDVADFTCHQCGNEWEGLYGYSMN
jgi:hypothetical protein